MPPELAAAPAPAQSTPPAAEPTATATPAPATAREAALQSGDFRQYRGAKQAEARGKPLPVPAAAAATTQTDDSDHDIEDAAAPAATAQPERKLSNRQQQINNYERRLAEQAEELRQLKARLDQPPAAASRTEPPAATTAAASAQAPAPKDYQRYLAMADAPTLESFEGPKALEEWNAAVAVFIADKRYEERQAADRRQADQDKTATAQRSRQATAKERFGAAVKADPTLAQAISPDVLALQPISLLKPGERATALNAVAEELLDSPVAPQLMRHFSDHPEELERLGALTDPRSLIREFASLEARFTQKPAAAEPKPKTVSAAPAVTTVGGRSSTTPADPVAAALKSGDMGAYRAAKRAALLASQ